MPNYYEEAPDPSGPSFAPVVELRKRQLVSIREEIRHARAVFGSRFSNAWVGGTMIGDRPRLGPDQANEVQKFCGTPESLISLESCRRRCANLEVVVAVLEAADRMLVREFAVGRNFIERIRQLFFCRKPSRSHCSNCVFVSSKAPLSQERAKLRVLAARTVNRLLWSTTLVGDKWLRHDTAAFFAAWMKPCDFPWQMTAVQRQSAAQVAEFNVQLLFGLCLICPQLKRADQILFKGIQTGLHYLTPWCAGSDIAVRRFPVIPAVVALLYAKATDLFRTTLLYGASPNAMALQSRSNGIALSSYLVAFESRVTGIPLASLGHVLLTTLRTLALLDAVEHGKLTTARDSIDDSETLPLRARFPAPPADPKALVVPCVLSLPELHDACCIFVQKALLVAMEKEVGWTPLAVMLWRLCVLDPDSYRYNHETRADIAALGCSLSPATRKKLVRGAKVSIGGLPSFRVSRQDAPSVNFIGTGRDEQLAARLNRNDPDISFSPQFKQFLSSVSDEIPWARDVLQHGTSVELLVRDYFEMKGYETWARLADRHQLCSEIVSSRLLGPHPARHWSDFSGAECSQFHPELCRQTLLELHRCDLRLRRSALVVLEREDWFGSSHSMDKNKRLVMDEKWQLSPEERLERLENELLSDFGSYGEQRILAGDAIDSVLLTLHKLMACNDNNIETMISSENKFSVNNKKNIIKHVNKKPDNDSVPRVCHCIR